MSEILKKLTTMKPVLTMDEACEYTGKSKSAMYKLTHERKLPFSKPNGKCIYFRREDLESWMMSNRVATAEEIADEATKRTASKVRKQKKGDGR